MQSTLSIKSNERIHSMDAIRAIAMLLGVVFHATLTYTTISINGLPNNPYDAHKFFDFLCLYLHLFRMPLFFIVAGFFARFLYLKIGEKAFIKHRFRRIVVPFLISLITIRPLTEASFLLHKYVNYQHATIPTALIMSLRNCFAWMGTFHLWFLYYLSIYYVVMLFFLYLKKTKIGEPIFSVLIAPIKHFSLVRTHHVLLLVLPVFILLMPFKTAEIGIGTGSIFPRLNYLSFYGFFFLLGLLLHCQIADLKKVCSNTWVGLVGGTLAALLFIFLRDYESLLIFNKVGILYLCKLLTALSAVLLTFGFLGLFMRYFSFESKKFRYISDSSYWVYLIHLPFVITVQALLVTLHIPVGIKFLAVLFISSFLSFATYEWFVRYTIIGTWLHGSRERKTTPKHKKIISPVKFLIEE